MFDDIGEKIKSYAVVCTWLGILASICIGIYFFVEDELIIGLGVMIGGSLVAWVDSFVLYGFGELISNTTDIRRELMRRPSGSPSAVSSPRVYARPYTGKDSYAAAAAEASKRNSADGSHTWTCPYCFAKNPIDSMKCKSCGSPRG